MRPTHSYRAAPSAALLASVVAVFATPAHAQSVTNVNVLNLLSPFLSLNGSATGQQALTDNLNSALAVNANAAGQTPIAQISISDKAIFGGLSSSITLQNGSTASYGPGANIGGGLPPEMVQGSGTVTPSQPVGALGQLGAAYQAAVAPGSSAVPSVGTLLTSAYSLSSSDLGVAKYYFANGTTNGTITAVAPPGTTLPTYAGLPNTTNSVFDTSYGVTNKQPGQDIYGDSRPVQVRPNGVNGYDPTALTGLSTNPSFPSGHTNYGYTDGVLIGMLVPQDFQAAILRGSEYGNSRIALGVHYPLDIIASRAFSAYDLAQQFNGNPAYAATNLPATFAAAQPALQSYLAGQAPAAGCGTIAACAASNPYLAASLATYGANTPSAGTTLTSNSQIFNARQTYGLATTNAPPTAAPASGPDASILLATVYGGSTAAAKVIAPSGGVSGNLSTATVNQIIQNTQSAVITAFQGTDLAYWSRINLYVAAGYFGGTTGSLKLAAGDQVLVNVSVGAGSIVAGSASGSSSVGTAAANNSVTVNAAGALESGLAMVINGALNILSGGTLIVDVSGTAPGSFGKFTISGTATLGGTLDLEVGNVNNTFGSGPNSRIGFLTDGATIGDFTGLSINGAACTATGVDVYNCGTAATTVREVVTANGVALDVTFVPEPASAALLLGPLAGIVLRRRRRG